MSKKKLTKSDLDSTLRELGFNEGDEIILPSEKPKSNEQSEDDDTGGSNPPPGKERPDKP